MRYKTAEKSRFTLIQPPPDLVSLDIADGFSGIETKLAHPLPITHGHPRNMSFENSPCAGEICSSCPNPTLTAVRKTHFGKPAWELECPHADEVHAVGKGIEIHCSELDGQCCVDDNREHFVVSPKIYPMRSFLEATLKYLGIKE